MTQPKKEKEKREKPKYNMWQISAFMMKLAWRTKEKKVLVLGFLTAALSVAGSLTSLFITPSILGTIEKRASLQALLTTILLFLMLSVFVNSTREYVAKNWLYGKITVRTSLISMLNGKMATTSYPNLLDDRLWKLYTRTDNALNCNSAAGEAIWETLANLLTNLAGFILYLMLLSAVSPVLFLLITLISILGYLINKPLSEYRHRHREEEGEINTSFWNVRGCAESPGLAKDIRLFGMVPWLNEIYQKTVDAYRAFQRQAENVVIWGSIADLILSFLRNGVVYVLLIAMVLDGQLSVSLFLLYFAAAGEFSSWVTGILNNLLTLHSQCLEISIIRECLEYPEPFRFHDGEPLSVDTNRKYEITLEDVSFRYPGAEKNTLSHIQLTLHPGEKLAVVGLNGAGKTTLVKLLSGFLDPSEGRVLLDGKDIREYNREDYYKMFSAVFQDFCLLPVTVAENVAQSYEGIDQAKVRDCIAKAGLTEKVESLPQQYDTKLNREIYEDAAMLSGGETQRLMLARALYKDAPIVVLDEPTAALDPIAEADLYNKYSDMTHGRSSVYISHRLASTRFCDRIILLEDGRLTEEGTHDALLAGGGRYAELFQIQSKYYQKEGNGEQKNEEEK